MKLFISGLSYCVCLSYLFTSSTVSAQIEKDNTLPVNSDVIKNGINFKINGGTVRGNNLFHSFKKFDVPTKGEAFFNNINSVENIFNRVTGGSVSNIDGTIKANGSANLFLMNPSGIIFGENARLNIGGSFLGTTADSIKFTDGEFSAINPQAPPLLTINIPLGLQMGTNPGAIQLEGKGHNLDFTESPPVVGAGRLQTGLRIESGKTLAMVGGDILFRGGVLNAPSGRIELGSVDALETVSFDATNSGWILGYQNVEQFRDIKLLSRTLLDASGFGGGDIQLSARNITLSNRSASLIQNLGTKPSGNINVYASESLTLTTDATNLNPVIATETLTTGSGGNITIETKKLSLQNGAVAARSWNQGRSGNITVNASNVEVDGIAIIDSSNFYRSSISAVNYGSGNGGDVTISTKQFTVSNGALISSSTLGSGAGGNITVDATDFVKLEGYEPQLFINSSITSSSLNAGNAGNLNINTASLIVRDGASINASAAASGDAGSITINAKEFVEVSGKLGQASLSSSNISSSAVNPQPLLQERFRLPKLASGNAGSVIINTPILRLTDDGVVTVRNTGTGNGGTAEINSRSLFLDEGGITATTAKGEGGNISLQADTLQMRRGSNITATAMGKGSGGNIAINTNTLVALENSDITANAQNSFGGKVTINAQGIFGIQQREQLTSKSDITATSQLGASFTGTVELNTPGIDPSKGVNQLPVNVVDPTNQIASGCNANTDNTFVVTGRGGIQQNPSDRVNQNIIWSDIRDLSVRRKQSNNIARTTRISKQRRIIEATGFEINQFGRVELVARTLENFQKWQQIPSCGEV